MLSLCLHCREIDALYFTTVASCTAHMVCVFSIRYSQQWQQLSSDVHNSFELEGEKMITVRTTFSTLALREWLKNSSTCECMQLTKAVWTYCPGGCNVEEPFEDILF